MPNHDGEGNVTPGDDSNHGPVSKWDGAAIDSEANPLTLGPSRVIAQSSFWYWFIHTNGPGEAALTVFPIRAFNSAACLYANNATVLGQILEFAQSIDTALAPIAKEACTTHHLKLDCTGVCPFEVAYGLINCCIFDFCGYEAQYNEHFRRREFIESCRRYHITQLNSTTLLGKGGIQLFYNSLDKKYFVSIVPAGHQVDDMDPRQAAADYELSVRKNPDLASKVGPILQPVIQPTTMQPALQPTAMQQPMAVPAGGGTPAAPQAVPVQMQMPIGAVTQQQEMVAIQVPAGVVAGTMLSFTAPSGRQGQVQVPQGVQAGQVFNAIV